MIRETVAMLGLAAVLAAAGEASAASDLALKRVMLSTGGVAYYEHEATVEGDATLPLDLRLDQVDDVLKSIVVYDDSGAVGSIRLPGREPMRQIFQDLPFDDSDLTSPIQLLNALQGVEVEASGTRTVRGRLMSVAPETMGRDRDGETVLKHRVTLMTPTGVQQFILEDAAGIRFLDDKLSGQIDRALEATARHRVMDRRTVEISVRGKAKRAVRVAYVVGAPLWKTAYRLTLAEGGDTGRLQGWAVLENQSGHDWNDVELTLVSGNPVTFRQALYESYYVDRPEVPIEVMGRILPSVDAGGMAAAAVAEEKDAEQDRARGRPAAPAMMMRQAAPAPVQAPELMMAPPGAAPARAAEPAEAREAATHVVFRMPRPVTVAAGQSLAVPIIDRDIPAKRVALFQRDSNDRHPLAAVRLVNAGDSGLPPGVLTVYERAAKTGMGAFVGDARIGTLPKGEERIASFALDQKIRIQDERSEDQAFQRASLSQGVLRVFSQVRQTTTYRIEAPKDAAPPVVLDHPRRPGWTLAVPDPKSVTTTPEAYRITVALGGDGRAEAKVMLERIDTVRYGLVDLTGDRLMALSRHGDMPEAMRNAFAQAARLKTKFEASKKAGDDLEAERRAIAEDQTRIRENLAAAPEGSDLKSRYLRKLADQEDRLEAIAKKAVETKQRTQAAQEELVAYINGLNF